jgi:transposase InsO family protein
MTNIMIDSVEATVDIYIVPDGYLSTPLLIGQTFTEQDHVVLFKTNNSLTFTNKSTDDEYKSISLIVDNNTTINNVTEVEFYTKPILNGSIYVEYSLNLQPGREYETLPGIITVKNGRGRVIVKNLSSRSFELLRESIITRACFAYEAKEYTVNRIDLDSSSNNGEPITLTRIQVDKSIDEQELNELVKLLNEHRKCFAFNFKELGCCNSATMNIQLKDKSPVVYRPYRLSYAEREVVRDMVEELKEAGIVCESTSDYASPIILVKKKTGGHRMCVDYRALNKKTIKEHYPLPRIDDQLDSLSGYTYYTTLDLASGYYQIPLSDLSKHLTAFVTPDGHYQFNRMPFGLSNAPANFQRTINNILGNARFKHAFAYMDDIIIPSKDINDGFNKLKLTLELFRDAGMTLNLDKCNFFMQSIDYLGFEVDRNGIRPGEKKIQAVKDFPRPTDQHKIRQFIGLASFFRRFVRNFSIIAKPLTQLLKQDSKFTWGDQEENAFVQLKNVLTNRPILVFFNPSYDTELHTDASKLGVAGILLQRKDKADPFQAVAYYSRQTSPEEMHFTSYDLETLAVVASLQRFRVYLIGIHFTIVTDCNSLRATFEKKDIISRVARWWNVIQEYDFEINYKPGKSMAHVDALSRNPVSEVSFEVNTITVDWIATVQQNDPEIQRTVNILKDKETNNIIEISKNFVVKRGLLYKITNDGNRWVVPKGVRWQIMRANHDDIGHFSFDKTFDRIKGSYWFPKMRRFIKKYVESCLECAHAKVPVAKKAGQLHPIEKIGEPFHTVHIDHLGPFVKSKHKNTHLLLIIDAFTKFIIITPVKNTKTASSIKALTAYFHTFGVPKRVISDRGTSFTSNKFKEFLSGLGVKHVLNAVSTPRANGQVERYNRTLLAALTACNIGKPERVWDDHISKIQWGMNNTLNKGIGKTPAQALFGTNLSGMADALLRLGVSLEEESIERDVIRQEMTEHIELDQKKQKERYDRKRKHVSYKVGDLVRIEREVQSTGQSKKLIPKLRGPYRITRVIGHDRYEVEDTPLSRKGNRPFKSIFAVDKIHPWLVFNRSDWQDEDENDVSSDYLNAESEMSD